MVKCVTNDIRVPADAEYVIEGYFDERGHVEPEGPYGEFLGYYGALKRNPVFHLTAITRRNDALFQTSTIGGKISGRTDTAQLSALRTEVMIWRALEVAVREPVAVYATTSSGGMFNVRVSMRQRVPGEARNAIAACFGVARQLQERVRGRSRHRHLLRRADGLGAGDALPARPRPDRDERHAHPAARSVAATGSRIGAKAGFDLTWPFGTGARLEASVPAPPQFQGKRFASVEAALADGPKFFEELMSAVGSRDGREIVLHARRCATSGPRPRRAGPLCHQAGTVGQQMSRRGLHAVLAAGREPDETIVSAAHCARRPGLRTGAGAGSHHQGRHRALDLDRRRR